MLRIRRYINQNLTKVIIGIFAITFIISFMISLRDTKIRIDKSVTYSNLEKTDEEILNEFIYFCYSNQFEEAYQMLSNDCINQFYQTVQKFQKNYCENIGAKFSGAKIEKISEKIYKVIYDEHELLRRENDGKVIEDICTVVIENDIKKININKYINTEFINQIKEVSQIKVEFVNIQKYLNYEIYNIKVNNKSDKDILLYDDDNQIFLEDNGTLFKGQIIKKDANSTELKVNEEKFLSIIIFKNYAENNRDKKFFIKFNKNEETVNIEFEIK